MNDDRSKRIRERRRGSVQGVSDLEEDERFEAAALRVGVSTNAEP